MQATKSQPPAGRGGGKSGVRPGVPPARGKGTSLPGRRNPQRPGGLRLVLPAVLALALTLGGCARVSPPDRDLAQRLEYDRLTAERYRLDPRWWLGYDDPRLAGLVETAEKNNLDLARTALTLSRALVQLGLARVDLYPGLSGGGSASVRKDLKNGGDPARSFSVNAGVSYEADLWGRIAGSVAAAEWEREASHEDLEAARLAVVNNVIDLYYNLGYLNDTLAENERNLQNLLAVERTVLLKYQSGQADSVEPVQAAQSVLSARDSLISTRRQILEARSALRNLLNLRPADPLDLADVSLRTVVPPKLDLDVPLSVLANRPDLRAAEFRLHKAFQNARLADRAWFPSISLSSAISSSADDLGMVLASPSGSAGLSINLPFLNWATLVKNTRLAEIEFETARLGFESALTAALNEVDVYYRNYETLLQLLEHSRRKYDHALRISDYYRDRYREGASELSDWLGAVNSANSARLSELNAVYLLISSVNQTFKAMAGRYHDLGADAGLVGDEDSEGEGGRPRPDI